MRYSLALGVERLESRDTPATFGIPWPDGAHLTLSFAPDGTSISGQPSNLQATLAPLGKGAELAILQAIQSWAVQADVNVGLVADNGAAFGVGRDVQGDPRFGDIRIGGRPLPNDVVALTAPYNPYNDYSGEVVLNTNDTFTTSANTSGYDLYTVLQHEMGHAFGLPDNSTPSSVMYEDYIGPRTGLGSMDVAGIQGLYGPAPADPNAAPAGTTGLATATPYLGPLSGELSAPGAADVYRISTGLLTSGITVNLKASGISLLTAQVQLLDSRGNVLAFSATTDPTNNDLTLTFNHAQGFSTYYVRVTGSQNNNFDVGAYDLDVKQISILTGVTDLVGGVVNVLNTTLEAALPLVGTVLNGAAPSTQYHTQGSFVGTATEYYSITVPANQSGTTTNIVATVWGQNGAILNPWIDVYDATGTRLAGQLITADGNTTTFQVQGLIPGRTYLIGLSSLSQSTGQFDFSAGLQSKPIVFDMGATGTIVPGEPETATLDLKVSEQVHFVLASEGNGTGTPAQLELDVIAANGTTVLQLDPPAGKGASADLFLTAGNYSIIIRIVKGTMSIGFQMGVGIVTDPIGAQPSDPTSTPQQTDPPPPPDTSDTSGTGASVTPYGDDSSDSSASDSSSPDSGSTLQPTTASSDTSSDTSSSSDPNTSSTGTSSSSTTDTSSATWY